MKTLFIGNLGNNWLMQGALHYAYENLPNCDPLMCYTPSDIKKWAETVRDFVRNVGDESLLVMLDDYWIQEVDADLLSKAEELMAQVNHPDKIDLSSDRMQCKNTTWDSDFVLSAQDAWYRTSLQAAIWKTEYLLKFCKAGWTPWQFEIEGSRLAMNDGAMILGTEKPCIRYVNVLKKGNWYGKRDF